MCASLLLMMNNALVVVSSEFKSNGIRVTEWIKVPLIYPGDKEIDEYLEKIKASGRSKCCRINEPLYGIFDRYGRIV